MSSGRAASPANRLTSATAPQAYLPLSHVEDACFLSRASFSFFAALCFCFLFLSLPRGDLSPIAVTVSRRGVAAGAHASTLRQKALRNVRHTRRHGTPPRCGIQGAAREQTRRGQTRWTSSAHGRTIGDPTTRGTGRPNTMLADAMVVSTERGGYRVPDRIDNGDGPDPQAKVEMLFRKGRARLEGSTATMSESERAKTVSLDRSWSSMTGPSGVSSTCLETPTSS